MSAQRTAELIPVVAAVIGNASVTVIGATAAIASGSSAMFPEAVQHVDIEIS